MIRAFLAWLEGLLGFAPAEPVSVSAVPWHGYSAGAAAQPAASTSSGASKPELGPLVFHAERARGTHPKIWAFVVWWSWHGPFAITIPEHGGVRHTDAEQAALSDAGASRASSLKDSAHGRAAGLDVMPAKVQRRISDGSEYVAAVYLAEPQAGVGEELIRPDLYRQFASVAKSHGFEAGNDWRNLYGYGPEGDAGHIQIPNWRRDLPFPPPTYSTGVA